MLDPATREALVALNGLDIALYARATELFERALASAGVVAGTTQAGEFLPDPEDRAAFNRRPAGARPFFGANHKSHRDAVANTHVVDFDARVVAARAATPFVVVLGMHRSGTSCVSGWLQNGLGVATRTITGLDNRGGHYEDRALNQICNAVLVASGSDWKRMPSTLADDDALRERRDQLVHTWAANETVKVLKDLRVCILWDFWEAAFADAPQVLTFRHPVAVVDSLTNRLNELDTRGALRLWIDSNATVLALAKRGMPLVEFGCPDVPFAKQLEGSLARWGELGWSRSPRFLESRRMIRTRG